MVNSVDLFCGAGGASLGIRLATGRDPLYAVNHDPHAIAMHTLNHPGTVHSLEDVRRIVPDELSYVPHLDILWLSPDCTQFSRAKGGKPVKKEIRSLAEVAHSWIEAKRPVLVMLENVAEFEQWGPLDALDRPIPERKGEFFRAWVDRVRAAGYAVEWRVLNAADYGAPTARHRLFVIARRDGRPVAWPEPTHGPGRSLPYRTAAECIDWSIPAPSIFARSRPLADKTLARIAHGLVRHVLRDPDPFLAPIEGQDVGAFFVPRYGERPAQEPRSRDARRPLPTVVPTANGASLVAAHLAKHYGGMVGPRLDVPAGTITERDSQGLTAFRLDKAAAFVTKFCGSSRTGQAADAPLGTVSGQGNHHGLVAAFLAKYYGAEGQTQSVSVPLHTITTKGRFGLVGIRIRGEDYVVTDIGMRMLDPSELQRAQGFPDDYVISGTKTQRIARIGNSVPPQVVEALVRANSAGGRREVAA